MENKTIDEMAVAIADNVSNKRIMPREWDACVMVAKELLNNGEMVESVIDIIEAAQVFELDPTFAIDRMFHSDEEKHRDELIDLARSFLNYEN